MEILYENLLAFHWQDLGIGMLVIFLVIGLIILSTKLINYLFSDN